MIGWTYLSVCLLYIPTRAIAGRGAGSWFTALSVLNILCCAHWVSIAYRAPFYIWPFKSGAGASIVLAGLITSLVFLTDEFAKTRKLKIMMALGFAAIFSRRMVDGAAGNSKVHATPAWCLFSSGAAICIFLALYWVCDVLEQVRWATFVLPAGCQHPS